MHRFTILIVFLYCIILTAKVTWHSILVGEIAFSEAVIDAQPCDASSVCPVAAPAHLLLGEASPSPVGVA